MISYAITFLAGGYLIPFTAHAFGIYREDRKSPDGPTVLESLLTAIIGAALWPLHDGRYEGQDG